jgi:glycosyltransferase involved in cell wall biosynthesis
MSPRVTVLMSVYNGEQYLREAIDSILNQTFTDFEFLIIDDSSTDNTNEILHSYNDPRIRIIRNIENLGLTKSLNIGLGLAEGEYIARMDADDISTSKRFEYQVRYLDENPDIAVVGTGERVIDEKGNVLWISKLPDSHHLVRWGMYFGNCICHPSVMMRRSCVKTVGFYNNKYVQGQDYDLWIRLLQHYHLANIPDDLLCLRKHQDSISVTHTANQQDNSLHIAEDAYHALLNEHIPQTIVAYLQYKDRMKSFREYFYSVIILYKIYRTFVQKYPVSKTEKSVIRLDVMHRFYVLSKGAIARILLHRAE